MSPENRERTTATKGRFEPGRSGNPGGRSRLPAEFIDAVRATALDAVDTIVRLMTDEGVPANVRLRAAELLLERAYGRPPQVDELPDFPLDDTHRVYYIMSVDSREVIRKLVDDGWTLDRVKGDHHQYRHPSKPGAVTVPHPKRDISTNVLRSIFRQAGWDWSKRR